MKAKETAQTAATDTPRTRRATSERPMPPHVRDAVVSALADALVAWWNNQPDLQPADRLH